MLQIKSDIDDAIIQSRKMNEFFNLLENKGYDIYERGMYLSVKSPYFARNIRLERAFDEDYSYYGIQDRIYYGEKEEKQKNRISKKYYRKIYKGPKIDSIKLKFSSFYRSYVRWLYKLGKLPPKIEYEELTPEYFKQRKETLNILEENSFIARYNINSIQSVKNCEEWLSLELAEYKGEREMLWRQYNKAESPEKKLEIKKELDIKTIEIETCSSKLKICRRFIKRKEHLEKEQQNIKKHEIEKFTHSSKSKNKRELPTNFKS